MENVNCSLIALDALENAMPVTVEAQIAGESVSLLVLRVQERVYAYANRCPHQGRRLDYAPGRFLTKGATLVCAAHGAVFAMNGGECLQGPCRGESLAAYRCEWQDGRLRVFWQDASAV